MPLKLSLFVTCMLVINTGREKKPNKKNPQNNETPQIINRSLI